MNNILAQIRAEKAAWNEAYLAASEEERARMLEEKARKHEEEEKLRQQRIYDDRKARFIEKCDREIACTKSLKKAVAIALDVTKSFDGKVLNNRLTNAVQDKLGKSISAVLTISYDYNTKNNVGKLTIREGNFYGCYNSEDFKICLSPFEDGNRVMWKETEEALDLQFDRRIKEMQEAKKSYDKVYKKAMAIEKAIKEYSNENYYIRNFFKTENVIRNTFYL